MVWAGAKGTKVEAVVESAGCGEERAKVGTFAEITGACGGNILRGLRLRVEGVDEGSVDVTRVVAILQDLWGLRLGLLIGLLIGLHVALAASAAHDLVAITLSALFRPMLGWVYDWVGCAMYLLPPTFASSTLQCVLSIAISRRWYNESWSGASQNRFPGFPAVCCAAMA